MKLYSYGQWTKYLIDKMEIRETDRVRTSFRFQFYYPSFNFDGYEFRFTLDNCFRMSWSRHNAIHYYAIGGSLLGIGVAIEYAKIAMPLDPQAIDTAIAGAAGEQG